MRLREFNGDDFLRVPVTQDLDQVLPYAHYTDDRFREARVVFGVQSKDLSWDYSDRRKGETPTESSVLKMAQLCQQHPEVYGPWVRTLGGRDVERV
jgi:hypothetical protein